MATGDPAALEKYFRAPADHDPNRFTGGPRVVLGPAA